jgi:soluble lytic murein transglycosylase
LTILPGYLIMPRMRSRIGLLPLVTFVVMGHLVACGSTEQTPPETPTPEPSPTPVPSLTPTPSPTPEPIDLVEQGEQALFYGDWDRAFTLFDQARQQATDGSSAAAAAYGNARTLLQSGRVWEAVDAFTAYLAAYPDDERVGQAHYLRAQAEAAAGLTAEALSDYQTYRQLEPGVLDSHVDELAGDLMRQLGRPLESIPLYQSASAGSRLDSPMDLDIKIGRAYLEAGDHAAALEKFDTLMQVAADDATRATLNFLAGTALESMGDTGAAYGRYQDSIDRFPDAYDSYSGLVRLVDAGVEVDELQRGIIDFNAGAYEPALRALDRALASSLSAEGFYYRGLTRRALGDSSGALADFNQVVDGDPNHPLWPQAVLEKARTQWGYLAMYSAAVDTFLSFVDTLPAHPKAPEALFLAARTAERVGDLDKAASLWLRLPDEYPNTPQAYAGTFLAGISAFRLGDQARARAVFEQALVLAADSGQRAQSLFWIGKTYAAQGADDPARQSWERAAAADPTGYYSVRAAQVLAGRPPFASTSLPNFSVDLETERAEAEGWLRSAFGVSGPDPLSALTPELSADPRVVRGMALWELGEYGLAKQEFTALRTAHKDDAESLYRLMHVMLDLGLYQPAIFTARQILDLAGMDDAGTMNAPVYFNHIRFGPYFGDLILPEAAGYGIDGVLLLSLVRQESLFEGFATSYAAARGLTQVIPPTGQNIYEQLGWPPDYTSDDLYRPLVSVRFGTWYLSRQLERYDGDPYAALAAYNAGPGNADIWKELAPEDPDLFLEIVRLEQPQNYIRSIQEVFEIYQRLYAP